MSDKLLELNERLISAAYSGDFEETCALLEAGAEINFFDEIDMTALHYACETNNKQLVHYLLKNGADVNAHIDEKAGDTPVIIACRQGNLSIVKLLMKFGANPYIQGWMANDALDHVERRHDLKGNLIKEHIIKICPPPKTRNFRGK